MDPMGTPKNCTLETVNETDVWMEFVWYRHIVLQQKGTKPLTVRPLQGGQKSSKKWTSAPKKNKDNKINKSSIGIYLDVSPMHFGVPLFLETPIYIKPVVVVL